MNLLCLTRQRGDTRLSDYLEDGIEYKLFHYDKIQWPRTPSYVATFPFKKKHKSIPWSSARNRLSAPQLIMFYDLQENTLCMD